MPTIVNQDAEPVIRSGSADNDMLQLWLEGAGCCFLEAELDDQGSLSSYLRINKARTPLEDYA